MPNWRDMPEAVRLARQDEALARHEAGQTYKQIGVFLGVGQQQAKTLAKSARTRPERTARKAERQRKFEAQQAYWLTSEGKAERAEIDRRLCEQEAARRARLAANPPNYPLEVLLAAERQQDAERRNAEEQQ